ncbi:hypothetical protein CK203_111772 [Vitis vinifera]|uniref:Uncharacterized protein n=1 Tax=Vitis vinifera TaxID=29760 RepID=A0A438CF99_VITVI|nr:hypothetical protein CK203_111772 [Vitis vinifera]
MGFDHGLNFKWKHEHKPWEHHFARKEQWRRGKQRSQESNASNRVRFGAEMRKIWPSEDNCIKPSNTISQGDFLHGAKFDHFASNGCHVKLPCQDGDFQAINEYRKVQKSRRDKHIYNHYLGRKGYARFEQDILQAEGGIGRVDRSVLWKKAREKKGKFNKIIEPVINMIVLMGKRLNAIIFMSQALGKPDHPGRVVGQDRLVRLSSYFHPPSDDMKKNQRSNMGNVVAEKPIFKMIEEPQPPEPPLKHKVIKCKLAMERKGNVVVTGTLIKEKGSNRLVVINVAHKPDARLPFPNPYGIINVGDAIGFELD